MSKGKGGGGRSAVTGNKYPVPATMNPNRNLPAIVQPRASSAPKTPAEDVTVLNDLAGKLARDLRKVAMSGDRRFKTTAGQLLDMIQNGDIEGLKKAIGTAASIFSGRLYMRPKVADKALTDLKRIQSLYTGATNLVQRFKNLK